MSIPCPESGPTNEMLLETCRDVFNQGGVVLVIPHMNGSGPELSWFGVPRVSSTTRTGLLNYARRARISAKRIPTDYLLTETLHRLEPVADTRNCGQTVGVLISRGGDRDISLVPVPITSLVHVDVQLYHAAEECVGMAIGAPEGGCNEAPALS